MRSSRAFSCCKNESESTVRDISKRTTILDAPKKRGVTRSGPQAPPQSKSGPMAAAQPRTVSTLSFVASRALTALMSA